MLIGLAIVAGVVVIGLVILLGLSGEDLRLDD